jgi:hypothetical protein
MLDELSRNKLRAFYEVERARVGGADANRRAKKP